MDDSCDKEAPPEASCIEIFEMRENGYNICSNEEAQWENEVIKDGVEMITFSLPSSRI